MRGPLRCDQCGATLVSPHIERNRKRFCCSSCLKAFLLVEPRAISPHVHPRDAPGPGRRPQIGKEMIHAGDW